MKEDTVPVDNGSLGTVVRRTSKGWCLEVSVPSHWRPLTPEDLVKVTQLVEANTSIDLAVCAQPPSSCDRGFIPTCVVVCEELDEADRETWSQVSTRQTLDMFPGAH